MIENQKLKELQEKSNEIKKAEITYNLVTEKFKENKIEFDERYLL